MKLNEIKNKLKAHKEVKIIFRQSQAPGDILTLTAAIRDFKKAYPNTRICMKTSACEIWENNPYVEEFEDADYDLELNYPLINESNSCGKHMIHGFKEFIEQTFNIIIPLKEFKCDVHLSEEEKGWICQVEEEFGYKGDFWLFNCGSKGDFPLKQWPINKWADVIYKLKDQVQFVQVGSIEHKHDIIELDGVYNLVGKTNLRQLIRLAFHSKGAIGHVSMLNHLMSCWNKPSIVIAGGRETATWEAYNTSRYLNVIGSLDCCESGGCWKSKKEECSYINKNDFPLCMNKILPIDVIRAFRSFK